MYPNGPGGLMHRGYINEMAKNKSIISVHRDLVSNQTPVLPDLFITIKVTGYQFKSLEECLGISDKYQCTSAKSF
jgi:hypothetical protein